MEFDEDNGREFDFLKTWTLNGPAWTWMYAYNETKKWEEKVGCGHGRNIGVLSRSMGDTATVERSGN
jgi:hypothetical protein